jgi:riboflavin synthase
MFTGIIETIGQIVGIEHSDTNIEFTVATELTNELKIDQSVAHNGVCLTVTAINDNKYKVTAIQETLLKTNLSQLQSGDKINIERAATMQSRLDGHMVQGHVDTTAIVVNIIDNNGSWNFVFKYKKQGSHIVVDKGSVCINGVSLTVVDPIDETFCVSIIPFTYEHTTFSMLKIGDKVNIEFDILGKYIYQYLQAFSEVRS